MTAPRNEWQAPPPDEDPYAPPEDQPVDWKERLRSMLLDSDGLDSIEPPVPLVEGIFNRNTLVWIQGKRGHAKSLVGLDLTGCVGTGHHWHGHAVEQGDVWFIAAEGVSGSKPRTRAWEESHGQKMTGVRWLPYPVQADNAAEWRGLIDLAEEIRPVLIVIDTQARVTVGMEENAAKDMGVFVDRLDRLRRVSGATVLIIHHMGRNGEHMRGSTALEGAADTIIQVTKDDELVAVSCEKQKEDREFDDIPFKLVPVGDSVVIMPADGGITAKSTAATKFARKWWDVFRDDWCSVSRLEKADVGSERTIFRHLRTLLDGGAIEPKDHAGHKLYRLRSDPDGGQ